ncbi:MAG: hypothetical protein ACFFD4_20040 [Candidatus Odinarchaeota archaeon]
MSSTVRPVIDSLIRIMNQYISHQDLIIRAKAVECESRFKSIKLKLNVANIYQEVIIKMIVDEQKAILDSIHPGTNPSGSIQFSNPIQFVFGEFSPIGSENIKEFLASSIDYFSYNLKCALDILATIFRTLYSPQYSNLPEIWKTDIRSMTDWFHKYKQGDTITGILIDDQEGIQYPDPGVQRPSYPRDWIQVNWFDTLRRIRNDAVHKDVFSLINVNFSSKKLIFDSLFFSSTWSYSKMVTDVIFILWTDAVKILTKLMTELQSLIISTNTLHLS